MFKKFWLDVILGTLFIFAMMFGIANMAAFKIFDIFDRNFEEYYFVFRVNLFSIFKKISRKQFFFHIMLLKII